MDGHEVYRQERLEPKDGVFRRRLRRDVMLIVGCGGGQIWEEIFEGWR